ncbi:MAG TPA: CehA/McbA family metallohydrolase [Candidatus Bathyarchaeia archaeon]|nr:CehA/McbA family metallohydrolase [Candidatus Bathyarchaeia archaeon]
MNMIEDSKHFRVYADLHVHTTYSSDSVISPKDLVFYAKKRGLNAVAVTDHNQIAGALKIAKETDFLIIPGTEVSSADGHIVGLNVHEAIPKGLGAEETVDRIHAAGGLAVACHPYVLFKGSLGKHVSAKFDAVEVMNARAFPFNRSVRKAEESAFKLGLSRVAGTDAHYGPQVGYAYTAIDSELNVEAIAKAILNGRCQPFGQRVPFFLNIQQQVQRWNRWKRKLGKS